jgi:tetratricopeptide (TPR) repeat protein
MNVWDWVVETARELDANGHERLAGQLFQLPFDASEVRTERVDAAVPEIIAQAGALQLPWLEVFARHWRLQARADGARAIPEAVDLFERAHREDTRACPQSVCTTQDLARAYGRTDGPGYAAERVAVTREILAGIDPSWACFTCLTDELSDALADGGDPAAAVAAVESAIAATEAAGEEVGPPFRRSLARRLVDAGRPAEALAILEPLGEDDIDDLQRRIAHRITLADALTLVGRFSEAREVRPAADDIERSRRQHLRWAQVTARLVDAGEVPNDATLGVTLHRFLGHLVEVGSYRCAFDLAGLHAGLALARGAGWVAVEAVAIMRQVRGQLVVDGGAGEALARAEAAVAAHDAQPIDDLPVPATELLAHLEARPTDEHTVEREVEWLRRAAAEAPDERGLVIRRAELLLSLDRVPVAAELLDEALSRWPDDDVVGALLGEIALRRSDEDAVDALVARLDGPQPLLSRWIRARWASSQGRLDECRDHCRVIVEQEPEARNSRRLWATCARRLGDHAEAMELWLAVAARSDEAGPDDWEAIVDASVIGRWDVVRERAARLGMELPGGDGPIDEPGERVVLVYEATDGGEEQQVVADRCSPATARVVSVAPEGAIQRAGDLVVFDPTPIEPPPEDPEEREGFVFTFPVVAVLEPGNCRSWVIDGVAPGLEELLALRAGLAELGVHLWIYSDEGYRLTTPDGDDVEGIYGRVAAPATVPPVQLDQVLTALTAGWAHPLTWLDLATEAGTDTTRHKVAIEQYGL